ncbi:predicted protein [Naegleria gruberi]|uniref:Predicted protein n=1 Tax=Naegleria gruberi TaxID=5762 RepID=D2UX68_NAEGR|nr:uncharacterized protein NAEGRDRAFT_61657 [Naegleria gruberi]EFC50575.1 predicted protein [Naegleria gruberi]|eukprot:XP_002683319.1 predicted protein [Naegleria gruberi strain NEG-M]
MLRKSLTTVSSQGGKKLMFANSNKLALFNNNNITTSSSSFHTASQKFDTTKPAAAPIAQQQQQKGNNNSGSGQQTSGGSMGKTVVISTLLTGALGVGFVLYFNNYLQSLEKKNQEQASSIESQKKKIQAEKLEQDNDKINSINSELEGLEKAHSAKLSALKETYTNKMNELQHQLNAINEKITSLEKEKNDLSVTLEKNRKKQLELLSEKENLISEKKTLEDQLNSFSSLKVRSTDAVLSDILGRQVEEGEVLTEEDRDKFLSRIQRLESQVKRKDKMIEQIKQETEENIQRIKTISQEKLRAVQSESEESIKKLESEMESVKNEYSALIAKERETILDEFEKKMQEQAHSLLIGYYDSVLDRSKHVQELTNKVYAMEETFKVASANFSNNIDLQNLTAAVLALQDTLQTNAPFKPEVDTLKRLSDNDEFLKAALESIPKSITESGVLKLDDLTSRFKIVKKKAIEASLIPEETGLMGLLLAKTLSVGVVAEEGFVDGDSLPAILSRAEFYLKQKRLTDAVNEINKAYCVAPKNVTQVIEDWATEARNRLLVEQVLETMSSHLVIQSHSLKQQK